MQLNWLWRYLVDEISHPYPELLSFFFKLKISKYLDKNIWHYNCTILLFIDRFLLIIVVLARFCALETIYDGFIVNTMVYSICMHTTKKKKRRKKKKKKTRGKIEKLLVYIFYLFSYFVKFLVFSFRFG